MAWIANLDYKRKEEGLFVIHLAIELTIVIFFQVLLPLFGSSVVFRLSAVFIFTVSFIIFCLFINFCRFHIFCRLSALILFLSSLSFLESRWFSGLYVVFMFSYGF